MYAVRARALQSAAAAPANARVCSRQHGRRHDHAGRLQFLKATQGERAHGFHISARQLIPPENPGRDGKDKSPEASSAAAAGGSGDSNAADGAHAPKEKEASAAAPAAAASASTYTGGRTRGIRSRAADGTPPYTLPGWFKAHQVRSFDNHLNENNLLNTTLAQDLHAASLLVYPRTSAAFSTAPEERPLRPIPYEADDDMICHASGLGDIAKDIDLSDHELIYGYFDCIMKGSQWTDDRVKLAFEQMRSGTGLDAIVRRGASVAAAATYSAAALASRPADLKPSESEDPLNTENSESAENENSKDCDDLESFLSSPTCDFYRKVDPHKALDIPATPFATHLVEFVRLTYLDTSAPYLQDEADVSVKLGIPISTKFYERAMFRDLQSTVATGLLVPPPDAKAVRRDWRRPVTVVTMMQHSSQTMTEALMDEIALSLSARIVHIDARTIASVAGPYLGQSPWLSRGTISMLGYTVARINGKLLPRYPKTLDGTSGSSGADADSAADGEDVNEYVYSRDGDADSGHGDSNGEISLSRLPMDFMSTTRTALRSDAEDRWDDLKMNHVLEAIVRSADDEATKTSKTANANASKTGNGTGTGKPPVIIHLHNFVELSSNFDGNQILYKLRGIVDKLWLKERRRVLLVGSTNISHKHDAPEMIDRAEELRQEDCDIFPYQLQLDHPQYTWRMVDSGRGDVWNENVHNIFEMVSALTGTCMASEARSLMERIEDYRYYMSPLRSDNLKPVLTSLQSGVYDIHRVYRIAMLWVGIVKGKLMKSLYPEAKGVELWDAGLDLDFPVSMKEESKYEEFDCFHDDAVRVNELITKESSSSFFNNIQDNATALTSHLSTPASPTSPAEFNLETFIHACWTVGKFDQMWHEQGGAKGNYQSPLLIKRYRNGKKIPMRDLWWWKTPAERAAAERLAREKDDDADIEEDEDERPYVAAGGTSADAATPSTPRPAKPDYKKYNFNKYEQRLVQDIVDPAEITTTFDTIVLPAKTKEAIQSLTTLTLMRPDAFSYGVLATEHIPGCLLYGPPGTGKTLLAKAVAKQSGFKMLEVSGATMNGKYVGETEKNIRAAFTVARTLAPSVLFIDEADALLGARNGEMSRTGHAEKVNQFLREIDGLKPSKGGHEDTKTSKNAKNAKSLKNAKDKDRVFLMVATNRPGDIDEAVLRRLPRRILVDLPQRDARLAILRVMLRNEQLDAATLSLEKIADDTELYSGSDLKNVCVAAAMQAVRDEMEAMEAFKKDAKNTTGEYVFPARRTLTGRHFEQALQEISASISENMSSLKGIRKFDEQYGDEGAKRRKKRQSGMGFEVVPRQAGTKDAMVRRD